MGFGLVLGLFLYSLVLFGKLTFRVPEGHVATLESFGAALFEDSEKKVLRLYSPGLHFKKPWEKAHVVCLMEQHLDLSGEMEGRSAMTEDGTLLRFDSILRYAPVRQHLYEFVYGMRSPLEHIKGLFTCLLRNEIANFRAAGISGHSLVPVSTSNENANSAAATPSAGGSYGLLRRERRQLNERIEAFCKERIGHRYGVAFNAVDLVDILPPDELADALNSVMSAHAEAQAAYFRAESDCQQRLMAADRGVLIAREHARAAETEILTLAKALSTLHRDGVLETYIKRRHDEVMAESRLVYVKEPLS